MQHELDDKIPIKFPEDKKNAYLNKSVKVIDLINKKVQITYSLN